MLVPERVTLLRTLCDLMSAADRHRILRMHPGDFMTFTEAYCAVRTNPDLTPQLRQQVVQVICALMDAETDEIVRARSHPDPHGYPPTG